MAKFDPRRQDRKRSEEEQSEQKSRRPPRVDYNLEKEPLRTGRTDSSSELREYATMQPGEWTIRRRMAGWIAILLMTIIIAIGAVVIFDISGWFDRIFELAEP